MSQVTHSIALFQTEGSSDKEYRVQLVQAEGGWLVNFQNGRRGKPLRHGTKTVAPVAYEVALELYEKLVKSKKKGGYTENEDGRSFQDLPDGLEHSGLRLKPLFEVDASDDVAIEKLLKNPEYYLQQKHDGERRAVVKDGDRIYGTNLEGIIVPLSTDVVDVMRALPANKIIIDGEDMGTHIAAFDILHLELGDTTKLPFEKRIKLLDHVIFTMVGYSQSCPIRSSATARTEGEKRNLFEQARQLNQEGLVFKHKDSNYDEGRSASQIKIKFRADATCQVIQRHATKRSASIGVLAEPLKAPGAVPTLIPVGNVTLPPSVEVEPGDLIDVKYLYAYKGGSLFQPVYKGHRTDKSAPDSVERLKYRGEDMMIDHISEEEDFIDPTLRPRMS